MLRTNSVVLECGVTMGQNKNNTLKGLFKFSNPLKIKHILIKLNSPTSNKNTYLFFLNVQLC